jgi:hypothetical protein
VGRYPPPPPFSASKIVAAALIGLIGLFSLTGCAVKIPVNKESAATNYKTVSLKQEAKTKYVIAVVAPQIVVPNVSAPAVNAGNQSALAQFIQAKRVQGYVANNHFVQLHQTLLSNAFEQVFLDILNKKGFNTTGPFKTFNDMTQPEKREAYLAATPYLTINFVDSGLSTGKVIDDLYYSQKGTLTLVGEFFVRFTEPLSSETMINKRINLADLKISVKDYVYEVQIREKGADAADTMLLKMKAPASITDNTEKVVAELLNEFFSKAVDKIIPYISREELLNLEDSVAEIKKLKRY